MRTTQVRPACNYRRNGIFGEVYCSNGQLVGTSKYDQGWNSFMHSPEMAARESCPQCWGTGFYGDAEVYVSIDDLFIEISKSGFDKTKKELIQIQKQFYDRSS